MLSAGTALAALLGASVGLAGTLDYNFSTQPADLNVGGNNPDWYVSAGGNPGGFLALTYSVGSQKTAVVFPETDPGKILTGFEFSCDLRIGNPSGDRAADGFSISFARTGDPLLDDANSDLFGGGCCAETGTKTGIAVSFDTWAGNTFPNDPTDKSDIEGIIVRVDDVTVQKIALPTRNGSADDITSLQTGPRNAAYWPDGDPKDPAAWAGLAWRPFSIKLTTDGKLTVTWKGNKVLDNYQTTYFPSGGRLVFAARTGGSNEETHVDNIHLTTTAQAVTAVPGPVGALTAAQVGSRRVLLTWNAATVAGDANAKVAYEVERDGVVLKTLLTSLSYDDRTVEPGKTYNYKVRGLNIAALAGPDQAVTAKTGTDVAGIGFLKAEQWTGINGTAVDGGISDGHFSDAPDRVRFVNGFSFGETSGFGDTWGDNFIAKLSGVFTAPKSGNFRFFVRSDDASALYLNTAGAAIPDVTSATAIATETGCCNAFRDVADPLPSQTSEVIALTKGKQYGIAFLVKEGGGGDWGQVALREEGDTTPAGSLTPLRGGVLASPVDATGASVTLTTVPAAQTAVANSTVTFTAAATAVAPYGGDYGNAIVYQWYVNGDAILNANSATYKIDAVPQSLNNADIKVAAGVAGAWSASPTVKLTVTADTIAPTVKRIGGSDLFNSATVVFSEPVGDSALVLSHYSITGLTLSAPVRVDNRTIRFTTSKQALDTGYPVTINGVLDNSGNPSAYTGTFRSFQLKKGLVQFGEWQGQTGGFSTWIDNGVQDLAPTTVALKSTFWSEIGNTATENYFGQLKALFTPATTGDYVFFMSSDDHGELYLSTNEDPANKKKIAIEPAWGGERNWVGNNTDNNNGSRGLIEDGARSNRSDQYADTEWSTGANGNVRLTAGSKYYIELLYKEGGGGDHGAATFKLKADADPADGSASKLAGDLVSWYADPTLLVPIITTGPKPVNFTKGDAISFSVVVDSAIPVTYQWFKTKHAIAGATAATLTIPNAGVANIGDYYVEVTNDNGTTSSYPDDNSRATMKGAFVIEAEDFNYGSGQTIAGASTMPLVAGLYEGKDGVLDVDFHNGESTGDSGANGNNYRNGWSNNGTVVQAAAGANIDVVSDNGGGGPGNQNKVRPDFELTNNYKIGWGDTGDWFNYTRSLPAGSYNAVVVYSHDGRTADAYGFALELVATPAQANSVTTLVGEVTVSGTGAWSSDDSAPLLAPGTQNLASIALGANSTLRLRLTTGGGGDIDYILLYPAAASGLPSPGVIGRGADGKLTVTWTSGKLQAAPSVNGPWTDVAGATSPYTFAPSQTQLFGRIVK